ncbi:hypothetical protein FRC10_006088 [Ceratobasidium sp. 414]|nr:hypothetical protein FRC10_006088 [Ceratobasidium sp. 414]
MSDDPATSTPLSPALLDRLAPDYRASIETQPPSHRIAFHTLAWSPLFCGVPGVPPPDLGQAPPAPVGSTRTIELYHGRFSVRVLMPEGEKPREGWPVLLFTHGDRECMLCESLCGGGTLSAVVAQRAALSGIPLAPQIIFTPLTNATFSANDCESWPPSTQEYEHRALDMLWLWDLYLPNPEERALLNASPLLQDDPKAYSGMAPAFVGAMELDVPRSEAEMYAEKMMSL